MGERPLHPLAVEALLERRALLRGIGAAAVVAAGGSALAACGSSGSDGAATATTAASTAAMSTATTAAPTTTAAPATSVPYDPTQPYWMQGNFRPVTTEVEAFDLEVTGTLPPELTGLYVRNGSNPQSGTPVHWFLGDGMLHGVRIESGSARWYRNRWVRTPLLGKDLLSAGVAPGGPNHSANTSVVGYAGRLLALEEVGWPYEVSPDDLSTVGAWDLGGTLASAMTAHPKIDPATGLLHYFGYGFTPPYLTYGVAGPDGRVVTSQPIELARSSMIHDFAITDRDVVFWELPVLFDLEAALRKEVPFRWDPSVGARVGVMPLGGPTSAIRWVDIEPCFVFHGIGAFRDGDDVVVDVCRQRTAFRAGGDDRRADVRRWRIGTATPALTFSDDVLADAAIDLPTSDWRLGGRKRRHAWLVGTRDALGGFEFSGISHLDLETGATDVWDPGPSVAGGEGLFVPTGSGEDHGVVMVLAYDKARDGSDLVVLDAADVSAGPMATIRLPQRVPFGFHGWWWA